MKVSSLLSKIFIFNLFFLFCMLNVNASSEVEFVPCVLSDAYLEWLELSDEEKDSTIMPAMCDREASVTNVASEGVKAKIESMFTEDVGVTLPSTYDIRNTSYKVGLKHQGDTGACWAFTTTTALEIYMEKKYGVEFVFSPLHLEYYATRSLSDGVNKFGYNRTLDTGGNYYMSASYLSNGLGPISEEDMKFVDPIVNTTLSSVQDKEVLLDVNDIYVEYGTMGNACTSNQIKKIKELVYEYGAVMANSKMVLNSNYYNNSTGASYYNGSPSVNHAIVIVGWDDNYSRTKFNSNNRPSKNGAWIVQNSYSDDIGDGGYNYISYEDLSICYGFMAILDADQEVEDNAYVHDKLGYNASYGFQSNSGYAMNVFEKSIGVSELLKEVTIGTYAEGSYKIYFTEGNGANVPLSKMTLIGSGDIRYPGYLTHELDEPILLSDNVSKFSIVVKYTANNILTPIPLSVQDNNKYAYVSIPSRTSYVSYDASNWYDLANYFGVYCIASIKAYTDDLTYSLEVGSSDIDDNYLLDIDVISRNVSSSKMDVKVYNSSGNKISVDDISYVTNGNKITNVNVKFKSSTPTGEYSVVIYYNDVYIETVNVIVTSGLYSDVYRVDDNSLLIYVSANTSYNSFISNVYGSSGKIYSTSNSLVSKGNVGTGMKIDGYTIIVKGDVNGDGYVKMNDVMIVSDYIVGGKGLKESYYRLAADVISDNSVKMNDAMRISDYIVKGGSL